MRAIDPALFPNVFSALREAGLDPARALVPVAPAAHYTIGGLVTDLQARSTLPGLYAIGETSCTGLHGANRLASNSLSECFVFGARASAAALDEPGVPAGALVDGDTVSAADLPVVAGPSAQTREAVWQDAGIERSREQLERLARNPHPLAALVARFALERKESRGVHQRTDYPQTDPALARRHLVAGAAEAPTWQRWE